MSVNVVMPKLGMTMTEGTVAHWLMQEGQQVEKGTPVLEIETEKIVHTVEAPVEGILHITAQEGTIVACGEMCGLLAASREEYQSLVGGAPAAVQAAARVAEPIAADGAATVAIPVDAGERVKASPAAKRLARELRVDISLVRGSGPEGRVVEDDVREFAEAQKSAPAAEPERIAISPVARKLAEDHSIDLSGIRGTGPGGRIVREDVLAAIDRQTAPIPSPTPPAPESPAAVAADQRVVARTIPLAGLRKAVAEHMMASLQTTAQLSASFEVDATELVKLRQQLLAEVERIGVRISYNDLIVRALIRTLKENPIFNSTIEGNEIKIFENVNMGIAVNLDEGLIVPVVHNADKMSLVELSKAISAVVEKARSRTLGFDDVRGGTFTLSNVGAFNLTSFTPIINAPEAAIVGVGGIAERPAVLNGEVVIRSVMTLCLTWDHRITDGVPAVQFAQTLKHLLENPSVLLV